MSKQSRNFLIIAVLAVVVFGVAYLIISATQNTGKNKSQITMEQATDTLNRLDRNIQVNTLEPVKESVDLEPQDLKDTLPDISKYPPQVTNTTADYVEIFSSTEKAGTGKDGWLVDMAKEFNSSGATVNGQSVSVMIRGIASGVGCDYISSGKYLPDAFSPSNELWGDDLKASGVDVTLVEKRLVGNAAGICLSKDKYNAILAKYGSVSVKTVAEATAAGEITMGYTNPFASSTGANFLMSLLYAYDSANPLSDTAANAFSKFQANVPFVAYTTLQMSDSVKSGVLDGFVFESQQLAETPDLQSYVFTPFGVRHDSPVYAIGQLSDVKQQILQQFVAFCKTSGAQAKATDDGFNRHDDYQPDQATAAVSGSQLPQAQKLWKDKKDSDKEIVAVFVADTSGSMDGEPLNKLKKSLLTGANYIGSDCSVGLVTFSNDVNIALPIGKFDINQRSLFTGAVDSMSAGGGTAMYDAIVVAEKMLQDAKASHPNAKLMLFVLTDGNSNTGYTMKDTQNMMDGLKVPIYTIGYNANVQALAAISAINEAANINADTDDVVYKIQNLFNAEM
jgi:Ca-activated chloride channel family protein